MSHRQISPTVSELESAVRRSESKEYQNGEQSGSDDDDSDDDDGFGEELVPSRPRRSAREKGSQQDPQRSPKSYFDSQTRLEGTQRRTERRARTTIYQGRGRPRKSDLQISHRQTESRSIPPTERRPRGRPRKDSLRAGDRVAVDLARAITLSHATGQGDASMALDGDADAEGDTDHDVDAGGLGPEEESPTHPSTTRRARNTTTQGPTTEPTVKRGRGRPRKNPVPPTHEEGTSNLKHNVYVSVPTRLVTKTRLAVTTSTSAGKPVHSQPAGHAPHLSGSRFEGVFLPPPISGKRVITAVAASIVAGADEADVSTSGNAALGAGTGERPVLKERKDLIVGQEVEGGDGEETRLDEVPPSEGQESEPRQEQEEEPNPDHALSTDLDFDQEQDFDPVLEGLVKGDTLSSLAGSNKG